MGQICSFGQSSINSPKQGRPLLEDKTCLSINKLHSHSSAIVGRASSAVSCANSEAYKKERTGRRVLHFSAGDAKASVSPFFHRKIKELPVDMNEIT